MNELPGEEPSSGHAVHGSAAVAPGESELLAQDKVLAAVLERFPSAVVYALDPSAVRAPVPDHELFVNCTRLPGTDVSLVDYVLPDDRMTVVRAWESAKSTGLGSCTVRLASEPDRAMAYTLADCRHRFGVLIGVLVPDDDPHPDEGTSDSARLSPTRPRTAILQKNLSGIITGLDERTTGMLGWTPEEMIGHRSLEFIHPDDHERAIAQWLEMRVRQGTQRVRIRHAHRDGDWIWVEVENVFVGLDDPDTLVAVAYLTDISDEMAAHEAVRQREALFTRLAESLPVGIVQITTDERILYANTRLTSLLAVRAGAPVADLVATVVPGSQRPLHDAIIAAVTRGVDGDLEADLRRCPADLHLDAQDRHPGDEHGAVEGEQRRCLFTITALSGQEGVPGAIVSVTDITDSARLREELRIKATYDPLTGCLNRASILAKLERVLAVPDTDPVAVLFVDLDHFKSINDTYGHAAGDEVIVLTARRLASQARGTDAVGRLGGDEFLLVCPGVVSTAHAREIAQRVHDHVNGHAHVAGTHLDVCASIGVTLATVGTPADLLVAQADAAMYQAKRTGNGPVVFTIAPDDTRHT